MFPNTYKPKIKLTSIKIELFIFRRTCTVACHIRSVCGHVSVYFILRKILALRQDLVQQYFAYAKEARRELVLTAVGSNRHKSSPVILVLKVSMVGMPVI